VAKAVATAVRAAMALALAMAAAVAAAKATAAVAVVPVAMAAAAKGPAGMFLVRSSLAAKEDCRYTLRCMIPDSLCTSTGLRQRSRHQTSAP
jgi:hypothetical protein